MRSRRSYVVGLLLVLALTLVALGRTWGPKGPAVTGRFEEVGGRRVLTLWGGPRERGFAHGYLMAERILDGIEHDFHTAMKPFLQVYEKMIRNAVVPRFAFTADEEEELAGLLEGIRARLPQEKLTLPALGREVDLVDLEALNTFGDWYGLGCASLAVWGDLTADGEPRVGRNFDFPAFDLIVKHQFVVVRAVRAGLHGVVGVGYPGSIGVLTGMNDDGVFVSIHDVRVKPTFEKAMRPNVPRLLAVRRLLEQVAAAGACRQAFERVRSWPTLYGNNLMIVAPTQAGGEPCAAVLEYDGRLDLDEGCSLRLGDGPQANAPTTWLCCTNYHRLREELPAPPPVRPRWRYDMLAAVGGAGRPREPFTTEALFAWMTMASFPRDGEPQQRAETLRGEGRHHGTLHQAVGEPAAKRLHVRLGVNGKNIREVEAHPYDVSSLVGGAR